MTEQVVLLDPAGRAVGTAPKAAVHHSTTPFHLAFSAYLFDRDGALLVTQRSLVKATFPGVWTNSVCGHPGPGEALDEAVRRRARDELGVAVEEPRLVLPEFRYVAELAGTVENEWCPVFTSVVDRSDLDLDPDEVGAAEWVSWTSFAAEVLDGRRPISKWAREQVGELCRLGPDPEGWPTADSSRLPPAAHLTQAPTRLVMD